MATSGLFVPKTFSPSAGTGFSFQRFSLSLEYRNRASPLLRRVTMLEATIVYPLPILASLPLGAFLFSSGTTPFPLLFVRPYFLHVQTTNLPSRWCHFPLSCEPNLLSFRNVFSIGSCSFTGHWRSNDHFRPPQFRFQPSSLPPEGSFFFN